MDWRSQAACLTVDPELFFPVGNTGPAIAQIAKAKEVCGRCEVVDTCLSLTEASGVHVITHRDLHDGQLLWDGTDLSLLDLDTAAMAEAALDLGNLWAHADLMAVRGRIGPEAHARVRGLLDDLARALPVTEQRLETYYRSSALRLVFVHAFRPAAHRWLPIWVRHCLGDASPFMSLDLTNDWNDS